MTARAKWALGILIGLVALGAVGFELYRDKLHISLPDYPPVSRAVWLDQGWSPDAQDWFHHADQGTQTLNVPYEWFIALEQPRLALLGDVGRLGDPAYLDRYGFIPGATRGGETQLPVGFARGETMLLPDGRPWLNPRTGGTMHSVGFTCAACHTGQFTFKGTAVLVDGGPALTDLGKFRQGLGVSILFTKYVPFRFDRFAMNVLGEDADAGARQALRDQLSDLWDRLDIVRTLDKSVEGASVEEGFGRLDALNRIGNQLFALDLGEEGRARNYAATTAPVSYPHIWDASWFDWVQYNASIRQPMVRNAGEALGVATPVNLADASKPPYASKLEVGHLARIEQQLAGSQPDAAQGFKGLRAPLWPSDPLPAIDATRAAAGAPLYAELCSGCHQHPIGSASFWRSRAWSDPDPAGQRYLHVAEVPLDRIGTDEAQAADMIARRVWTPGSMGIGSDAFAQALASVVERTVTRWYDDHQPPKTPAQRDAMNGHRPNDVQGRLVYKARPLDGAWATPPFLHNGSIPNVYALLSPVAERPRDFALGRREYDPVCLGYQLNAVPASAARAASDCLDKGADTGSNHLGPFFGFDASRRGNANTGHEFAGDGHGGKGVVGRGLQPPQRLAIVEFLKTDCVNASGASAASASATSCRAVGYPEAP